jgi:hypothetical protein
MTAADLTRTCQNPAEVSIGRIITALDQAWTEIRWRNFDVPEVVLVVASGSTASRQLVLGHFAGGRWQHGDTRLPEVLVSGEGLRRPATEVLTTLLHEAAHGLAAVRGIKDTSRQGRWHNRRFAVLADEVGLDTTQHHALGWSPSTLRPATAEEYADTLRGLTAALSVYRHPEPGTADGRTSNNNPVACECGCTRKIRVARTVLDLGPITCRLCGGDFHPTGKGGEPS